MNKFTIPTILVATIMVAGIFAFVPVEQASSVHLTGAITTGNIVANTVDSAAILDDTIGPEDFTGATDAAGFIHVEENSSIIATVLTTGYTPVVTSLAIVTCDIEGDSDTNAIVDGTVELTEDGSGIIQSAGIRNIQEATNAVADQFSASFTWVVSGIDNSGATVFTCSAAGTNFDATDITGFEIIALFIPE